MHRNLADIPEGLVKEHISASFISMIQWWIAEGLMHTPEEMDTYFRKIVLGS